jgi:hypothetical protein
MPTTGATGQPPARSRPLIEVLTVPGCPNRDGAVALAARVCAQLGSAAEVRVIDIADQPAAEQARFLGSPTIRVDGRDIEPGAQWQEEYVCACRLYQVEYGLRGLPDEDWLRQALLAAEGRQ